MRDRHAGLRAFSGLAAFLTVLTAQGYLPGMINSGAWNALLEGSMRCLDDLGPAALTSSCQALGAPVGFPLMSSGPLVYLGVAFMKVPAVGSYQAYLLAGATFCAVALGGGYGLMRRLGTGPAVALLASALYLLSPTILGLRSFGGTFQGFALLPTYMLVDLLVIGAVQQRQARAAALAIGCYAAVRTFALFLDGYSFVAAALVSGLLWGGWVLRGRAPEQRRLWGLAAFVVGNVVAVSLFRASIPGDQAEAETFLAFSRAFGLDLATIVQPSEWLALPSALGLATDHSRMWGDGSNSAYNYVGVGCLTLAIIHLLRGPRHRPEIALAAAGAIALVLALGPALKVGEVREATALDPPSSMPLGIATAELPWAPVFESAPGLANMRASYRWSAVTRLALIVLAGLTVQHLVRHRDRRWARTGLAVAALAVLEIAPNVPLLVDQGRDAHRDTVARRAALGGSLRAATRPGEVVFFLDTSQGHVNHFAVNDVSTAAGLTTYNTGGDKNAELALARWPEAIAAIRRRGGASDAVVRALQEGAAEVVVVPSFSLWRAVSSWPPPLRERLHARATLDPLRRDVRLRVEQFEWVATVRLAGSSSVGEPAR